jgi:hypothetical protein
VLAVSAAKPHTRLVKLGWLSVAIKAGSTMKVTVPLNATGKKLLAHFGKLTVRMSAVQVSPSRATLLVQNLTIRPASKKRKKH